MQSLWTIELFIFLILLMLFYACYEEEDSLVNIDAIIISVFSNIILIWSVGLYVS